MNDHVFTCPKCGEELIARSKAYARIKGANHLFKKERMHTVSSVYLDQNIKELTP